MFFHQYQALIAMSVAGGGALAGSASTGSATDPPPTGFGVASPPHELFSGYFGGYATKIPTKTGLGIAQHDVATALWAKHQSVSL